MPAERNRTLVLPVARGKQQRVAALPKQTLLLFLRQRSPQLSLLVFHFRANVFGQFADDVLALPLGQRLRYCFHVAVN